MSAEIPSPSTRRRRVSGGATSAPADAGGAPDSARTSLTPQDWIAAAIEVLVDQGIDHVRVEVLAGQLQVTRGSFYWHFRDRDDLLRRVLEAWSDHTTAHLTRRLAVAHDDPREQLRDILSLPFRGRSATRQARIELAIRAWARRDAMARQAMDASDARRLAYIGQVFAALGHSVAEARFRAFAAYSYVVGESLMAGQADGPDVRAERARFIERLLGDTPVLPRTS